MPDADELADAAAALAPLDQRVRTAAFQAVYRGEKISAAQLADRLAEPSEEVEAAIERLLARGLVTVDESGRVTGSQGLSLVPSDHGVTFEVGERYVWCAVDAVGIPAAMGVDAEVTSRCFHCGEPVSLIIEKGEPQPAAAGLPLIGIGVAGSSGKVNEDLCPMINFFCSPEHATAWAAAAQRANIIDVRQAAEMGRALWADVA